MLFFGSEDPLAPVGRAPWHHHALTARACRDLDWTAAAADEAAWATVGVDLYSYHALWRLARGRRRTARRIRRSLDALHFDDLLSPAEIEEVWLRLLGGTRIGLEIAADRDDVAAARHVIGLSLHAVQDFYSHSTWIDDPARRDRTWLEGWGSGPLPEGLLTGSFAHDPGGAAPHHGSTRLTVAALLRIAVPLGSWPRLPRGVRPGREPGINLDSRWQAAVSVRPGLSPAEAFDTAYDLARRDSRRWISTLAQGVPSAFWDQVMTAAPNPWTDSFEQKDFHSLISAGQYPPRGRFDSRQWFALSATDRTTVIGPLENCPSLGPGGRVVAFRRAPEPVWRIT